MTRGAVPGPPATCPASQRDRQGAVDGAGRSRPTAAGPPVDRWPRRHGGHRRRPGGVRRRHRGADHGDWLRRVSRWTTPQLAQQYRYVDPARIPGAALVGLDPVTVGAHVVDVTATYDTGLTLAVRLELGPEDWRVTRAQPTDDSAGPGGRWRTPIR